MTNRFAAPDLNSLPSPSAIEALDYEALLGAYRARLLQRFEAAGIAYDVQTLETDPAIVIGEAVQYDRLNDRARINDAVRAVLVPTSWGTNLDALGARVGTARLEGEADDRFRFRILLAYEALATTGTYGGYAYFALGASTAVRDVVVRGPESGLCQPGEVLILVIAADPANGQPVPASPGLLEQVLSEVDRRDRRPLTDHVLVRSAKLRDYRITAQLTVRSQIDPALARATAERRIIAFTQASALIGERVSRDALVAALGADDAGRVTIDSLRLTEPAGDIAVAADEVAWCTSVLVTAAARAD